MVIELLVLNRTFFSFTSCDLDYHLLANNQDRGENEPIDILTSATDKDELPVINEVLITSSFWRRVIYAHHSWVLP